MQPRLEGLNKEDSMPRVRSLKKINIKVAACKLAAAFVINLGLQSCSSVPTSGPTARAIVQGEEKSPYFVVDASDYTVRILGKLGAQNPVSFGSFKGPKKTDFSLNDGDTVVVNIYEGTTDGERVYSPLPSQEIDHTGTINIPYAGRVTARGKTVSQVEEEIKSRLSGVSFDPQVIVSVINAPSREITVIGDDSIGQAILLKTGREAILDVLAKAGGVRSSAHEVNVTITRGGESLSLPLKSIISNASYNVRVLPGDIISIARMQKKYSVFGSTGINGLMPFSDEVITLEEALATAGGLLEFRADPEGVFLLRFLPTALVKQISPNSDIGAASEFSAVIIRFDMSNPNSYFWASQMEVQDRDILYVSSAPIVGLQKIISVFQGISSVTASSQALTDS